MIDAQIYVRVLWKSLAMKHACILSNEDLQVTYCNNSYPVGSKHAYFRDFYV